MVFVWETYQLKWRRPDRSDWRIKYNVSQLRSAQLSKYNTFAALSVGAVMFRFFSTQNFLESTVVVQLLNNTATHREAPDLYDSYGW